MHTGPTHGGDYDPNHFDPSYPVRQSAGQQYDSPAMESKAVRREPPSQDSFYSPTQATNSSNPAGSRLSVGAHFYNIASISCLHC